MSALSNARRALLHADNRRMFGKLLVVVVLMLTTYIVPPILAACFPAVPIFYAWVESTGGFWFMADASDKLHFARVDGFTILPMHTQMVASIIGFYFGAGVAKAR